jgi:hypothetical protein
MMAKDIDRVCEKYEVKLMTGRSLARSDDDRRRQVEKFRQSTARYEEVRKAVAAVLCREGICTIWWPYYYNFGRKLEWLRNRIGSPEVLRTEARMQLEVWVARGLVRPVLEAIAREYFELDLTGPIPTLASDQDATRTRNTRSGPSETTDGHR